MAQTDPDLPSVEDVAHVAEFRAALRRFMRRSERIARTSGLTPQRHLLLLMIRGAPDGTAKSTVTELVRRAEEAGLVAREPSSVDGRVAHLRLTPEGERRLARSFRSHATEREELREIFRHLDAEFAR